MHVTIKFHDQESLTIEEVVRNAVSNYGHAAEVRILPDSTKAHDMIYFGLQQMMTHDQLGLLYDDKPGYQTEVQKLRNRAIAKVTEIVDQIIIDNEDKVSK